MDVVTRIRDALKMPRINGKVLAILFAQMTQHTQQVVRPCALQLLGKHLVCTQVEVAARQHRVRIGHKLRG